MTQSKIKSLEQLCDLLTRHRGRGERIVFTNGCFDLLHVGHVRCLTEAAGFGDLLVVGINSDRSVRLIKGPRRPIVGEEQRAAIVEALECVDYVVIFDEPTPVSVIRATRPDVLAKGGTYKIDQVVGRDVVEEYGGEVRLTSELSGLSTTVIIENMLAARGLAPECLSN